MLQELEFTSRLPQGCIAELKKDVKEGIKYTKMSSQKLLLMKLLTLRIATPEIILTAKKIISPTNTKRNQRDEKRIMKQRITTKNKEIREQGRKWESSSERIERMFEPEARKQYRKMKNLDLEQVWKYENTRIAKRIVWLIKKYNTKEIVPDIIDGIVIGDKQLEERFGEPGIEPAVNGGIEISMNMAEFLKLPAKFRIHSKISRIDHQIQTEVTAAKAQWNVREQQEHRL